MSKHRTAADYLKLLRKVEKDPNFVPDKVEKKSKKSKKSKKDKKGKKAKGDSRKPVPSPSIPLADLPKMVSILSASKMPIFLHNGKNGPVQAALIADEAKEWCATFDNTADAVRLQSVANVFANPDLLDTPGLILLTDLNKHLKGETASNEVMSLLWRTGYKAQLIGCVNVDEIDAHATMRAIHINLQRDESWEKFPF